MEGRWRYKLRVIIVFPYSIQSSFHAKIHKLWVDVGLQTYSTSIKYTNLFHYKDTRIMGGYWRYKLIVVIKYIQLFYYKDTEIMGGY